MSEILAKVPNWRAFDSSVKEWAAIRTAARWEKMLAENLQAVNVPSFLPLVTRITKYKSRTNRSEVPLFSGYVFFERNEMHRINREAPGMKGIAQILPCPDQILLKRELSAISCASGKAASRTSKARSSGICPESNAS